MSPKDIQAYLKDDTFKEAVFKLAVSVVIQLRDEVYKIPVDFKSVKTLTRFFYMAESGIKPKQVLLPKRYRPERRVIFLIFRRLHPPLDIKSIRCCFNSFAISVQSAVEELHRLGFAHLDLRVPNICFEKIDGQWQAVLIDLDYSCDIEDPTPVEKRKSIMYNVNFDRKEQYDWRQFAIMLARLLQHDHDRYHEVLPKFEKNAFGQALECCFSKGENPLPSKLKWEGQAQITLTDVLET